MHAWSVSDGSDGFHQHRKLLDPTLVRPTNALDLDKMPWFAPHDLAVRHLDVAAEHLGEEVDQIYGLLTGIASVATLREAEAQEQLNVIIAGAAVGLGVPGLVFAFYGAEVLAPLDATEPLLAVALTLAATLVVILIVLIALRRRTPTSIGALGRKVPHIPAWGLAVVGVGVLGGLLWGVGAVGPKPEQGGYVCTQVSEQSRTLSCTPR